MVVLFNFRVISFTTMQALNFTIFPYKYKSIYLPRIHSLCAFASRRFFWLIPGVLLLVLLLLDRTIDSLLIGVLLDDEDPDVIPAGVDTLLTACRDEYSSTAAPRLLAAESDEGTIPFK